MITSIRLEHPDVIQQLMDDYLHTLIAPMDGMWENAVIPHADFWEIQDQGQRIGHFCIDSNNYLLRFHLLENYQDQAHEIFCWIILTYNIHDAITSTVEPLYFSLCLSIQRNMTLHSYLFRDHKRIELPSGLKNGIVRKAEKRELDDISRFYHVNTEGLGKWIEPFIHKRLDRAELFVLYDRQEIVATGECIPSQKQVLYADLGMIVAQACRGRGLGSSMLIQLKQHCYEANLQPICSCTADNPASKKAIEKAGFISEHKMVKISL